MPCQLCEYEQKTELYYDDDQLIVCRDLDRAGHAERLLAFYRDRHAVEWTHWEWLHAMDVLTGVVGRQCIEWHVRLTGLDVVCRRITDHFHVQALLD